MPYRDELQKYVNSTYKLVGLIPNIADYSTGNMLLDTGTAYVFLAKLDRITVADEAIYSFAVAMCEMKGTEFCSNSPLVEQRISHDDVIGMVAGFRALGHSGSEQVNEIILEHHSWILSTDGKFYWDAVIKPWQKAYYRIAADQSAGIINLFLFMLVLILDALFNKTNSSDKKLSWLMIQGVRGRYKLLDAVISFWYRRTLNIWGSIKHVFETYYGKDHLFAKYMWE